MSPRVADVMRWINDLHLRGVTPTHADTARAYIAATEDLSREEKERADLVRQDPAVNRDLGALDMFQVDLNMLEQNPVRARGLSLAYLDRIPPARD